jgi:hypothetical protein
VKKLLQYYAVKNIHIIASLKMVTPFGIEEKKLAHKVCLQKYVHPKLHIEITVTGTLYT